MDSIWTNAAIYLTIWWTVLFAVLPLGTTTRAEAGLPNDGTDPGAPIDPKLKKKFITTTWVSAVVFLALWTVVHFKLVDVSALPWRSS
jgi:predicted secreted protein